MAERGELDLTGAKQNTGVWLVKVPKYLSQQWAKAPGRGEVGKLRIAKSQGRTEVSFTLNEDLANIHDIGGKPASVSTPREHPFVLQSVGGQTLTVFTESSSDKLSLEGIVVQRAECRPAASENYMRLKRLQIEESSKPVRLSQQLDKVVTTNYKPVANHQYNPFHVCVWLLNVHSTLAVRRAAGSRPQCSQRLLFAVLIKSSAANCLIVCVQGYLKEILKEIGVQNVKGTHKNTWELKPEYRHYQGEEKSD
ncbi:general transcription factor IIF subunit 2 [Enhydra lutris kenyoni]|uniref:General transcription factor IIF subunit 2 n=1 Tax=Enhydra lutris kenyoni TaxID=391180 RepID=A0A2Y9JCM9_ENHLU|nr:general transcription factor IIF subunit 2 [Enhydra lutris kenyoni]